MTLVKKNENRKLIKSDKCFLPKTPPPHLSDRGFLNYRILSEILLSVLFIEFSVSQIFRTEIFRDILKVKYFFYYFLL